MRYALTEKSTDMRDPRSVVKFTTSRREAVAWLKRSGGFTHADPVAARNYHHTFREVYEIPSGWRKPSQRELDLRARKDATPTYPRNSTDVLRGIVEDVGVETSFNEVRA